jgi:hypothetical protein
MPPSHSVFPWPYDRYTQLHGRFLLVSIPLLCSANHGSNKLLMRGLHELPTPPSQNLLTLKMTAARLAETANLQHSAQRLLESESHRMEKFLFWTCQTSSWKLTVKKYISGVGFNKTFLAEKLNIPAFHLRGSGVKPCACSVSELLLFETSPGVGHALQKDISLCSTRCAVWRFLFPLSAENII